MSKDVDESRAEFAAILRAAADLVESSPDVPVPYLSLHFCFVAGDGGDDVAATVRRLADGMPCAWEPGITGEADDRYQLLHNPGYATRVAITAPASALFDSSGTHAVTRTVTRWVMKPGAGLPGLPDREASR